MPLQTIKPAFNCLLYNIFLEFLALKMKMITNKDKQENMRKQAQLSTELQVAYKRGDSVTVKKLERMLAPDEVKGVIKHPWA